MSVLQKQADLGRTFFEINQNAFKEILSNQRENVQKYFELNSSFSEKLPEVSDISGFVALQKEYGTSFWSGFKDATKTQSGIIKNAFEESGEAVRKVFETESES